MKVVQHAIAVLARVYALRVDLEAFTKACHKSNWCRHVLTIILRQVGAFRPRTFFPLSFHGPIRRPVSRLPARPNHLPVMATCVGVWVWVTRRNRQHIDGWKTRVRGLQYSAEKIIVKLGDFTTVGAVHFYLAKRVVVTWHWVRPDHAEIMLAVGAHE